VPVGAGDRRWFVLHVGKTYAGMGHDDYWDPIYTEIDNGGAEAMLHDLLAMDLSGFNVRAIPQTAAKADQQSRSLRGTMAWLHHVLQEGGIGGDRWDQNGLTVSLDHGYLNYENFSKARHEWQPETKDQWAKKIHKVLNPGKTRRTIAGERVREFVFASLAECRRRFDAQVGSSFEWEPESDPLAARHASMVPAFGNNFTAQVIRQPASTKTGQ